MKKLIVIVSFLVLSASLFSQDKPYFSVPNKTSMFTKSLPVRQLVLLSDSGWLFQLTHGVTNWQTVAYVISNHWYRNVITDGVGTGGGGGDSYWSSTIYGDIYYGDGGVYVGDIAQYDAPSEACLTITDIAGIRYKALDVAFTCVSKSFAEYGGFYVSGTCAPNRYGFYDRINKDTILQVRTNGDSNIVRLGNCLDIDVKNKTPYLPNAPRVAKSVNSVLTRDESTGEIKNVNINGIPHGMQLPLDIVTEHDTITPERNLYVSNMTEGVDWIYLPASGTDEGFVGREITICDFGLQLYLVKVAPNSGDYINFDTEFSFSDKNTNYPKKGCITVVLLSGGQWVITSSDLTIVE